MQRMYALCILFVSAASDRCGDSMCDGTVPHGRSLLQKDAISSRQNSNALAEIDDKSLTTSLDLDVQIMEREVATMRDKIKVIEDTLGVATAESTGDKKTSLQQTATEPSDTLKKRLSSLETSVADLLSRTSEVETEVGAAQGSLLEVTSDPVMGLADRAIAVHVKVHNLQGRITKMEHTVVDGLKPDAMLLKKKVEVLEEKVNVLKSSVQGPVPSLLAISTSEEGLKSQVSDLEARVGQLLSTTTALETDVNGPGNEEALLEIKEQVPGAMGMANRARVLHAKVQDLQGRIPELEHTVLDSLKPDATLLKKEVAVLEDKVNTVKSSVEGPASSLLEVGSSEEGLKSQVSDLESRVGELLSTTATLETEVHGLSKLASEEVLLQTAKASGKQGLMPRVKVLKEKVSNVKSRVFTLEHHVTG